MRDGSQCGYVWSRLAGIGRACGANVWQRSSYITGLAALILLANGSAAQAWSKWELPQDVLGTSNQISFNQAAKGVWYFMQSSSLNHDPSTYSFLPDFANPCQGSAANAVQCWQNLQGDIGSPKVIVNPSDKQDVFYPPSSFAIAPRNSALGIVAWRSPITGTVMISGVYTALEVPCSNGLIWSVDKEGTILKKGKLITGSASFNVQSNIKSGDVIYFTIDPDGSQDCDTTGLKVQIKRL